MLWRSSGSIGGMRGPSRRGLMLSLEVSGALSPLQQLKAANAPGSWRGLPRCWVLFDTSHTVQTRAATQLHHALSARRSAREEATSLLTAKASHSRASDATPPVHTDEQKQRQAIRPLPLPLPLPLLLLPVT
jgi:hypothetical protein